MRGVVVRGLGKGRVLVIGSGGSAPGALVSKGEAMQEKETELEKNQVW